MRHVVAQRRSRLMLAVGLAIVLSIVGFATVSRISSASRLLFAAPFAAGDGSANVPLFSSRRVVMVRWVARRSGRVNLLYLRVRTAGATACSDDPGVGYGGGSGGSWVVATTRVLPDGRPDARTPLATARLVPCTDKSYDSIAVPLNINVKSGHEYATLIRNGDSNPGHNFSSVNFLYARHGVAGPNGRNDRNPSIAQRFYGLDPREAVGFSTNGGRSWRIPGGPYGTSGGAVFIPTFLEVYADGRAGGQPYYSSTPLAGLATMSFRVKRTGSMQGVGAYTSGPGAAPVVVRVNGLFRGIALLHGSGFISASLPSSISLHAGDTITLSTVAGALGLALRRDYSGVHEAQLLGLGVHSLAFLTSDPASVVAIYPLSARGAPTLP
jgi:hypothetical protein